MTAEECQIFDKLDEEIGKLGEQIAAVQAHDRRREASQKLIEDLEKPVGRQTSADDPAKPAAQSTFKIPATARRTGVLKAFKERNGAPPAEERAYRSGMWLRAHCFNDVRAQNWCVNHGIQVDIRGAMGTNSNPDGGFLVPDELAQSIIDLREEYGTFRRECRVWPMGSDTLLIPRRSSGVTISVIGENPSSAISQSSPTFGQVQLVARKVGGLTLLSSEISQDAVIDLADWVAGEFGYALAKFEDDAGFTGDGTSTYAGIRGITNILTEASGNAGAVLVATATHDLFSEVDATDLATLMAKLPQFATPNAKFYCSRVAAELVFGRLMASAGGNNVDTLQGGRGNSYLGYPIVISQSLPSVTTAIDGTAMLLFGDLRKSSSMGDRGMLKIFPSEHRYMDTDQIGIRCTQRFDIVNHDLGDTTTVGPMLALIGSTS